MTDRGRTSSTERNAAALQSSFAHLEDGEESGESAHVAGRIMLLRRQGKLAFATMRDSTGEIQLFVLDSVAENFEEFSKLHLGDWVGVVGELVGRGHVVSVLRFLS